MTYTATKLKPSSTKKLQSSKFAFRCSRRNHTQHLVVEFPKNPHSLSFTQKIWLLIAKFPHLTMLQKKNWKIATLNAMCEYALLANNFVYV
jgi:hypothetical protein